MSIKRKDLPGNLEDISSKELSNSTTKNVIKFKANVAYHIQDKRLLFPAQCSALMQTLSTKVTCTDKARMT